MPMIPSSAQIVRRTRSRAQIACQRKVRPRSPARDLARYVTTCDSEFANRSPLRVRII